MQILWGLLSLLSTLGLAIVITFFYTLVHKKRFFGGRRVAFFVGILGAILGGYIFDLLFQFAFLEWLHDIPYIQSLLVNSIDINFLASAMGIYLFLYLYGRISMYT